MADMRLRAKDRAASSEPSRLLAALQEGYNEAGETVQDYVDRTLSNNEKIMAGEINAGQRLLRSTGDVVGLFGGLAGDTLGVIGDLVVPDEFGVEAAYQENIEKPLQKAIMSAADTDIGRAVVSFTQENPELTSDLGSIGNVLAVAPVGKIANAIARNMPTEVRGFYSGNPLLVAAGVAEAATSGAKDALASAFNPRALALQDETGITKGLVRQAKKAEALVTRRTALATKADAGDPKAIKALEAFDKKHKGYGSMTEGALAYNYLFRKQLGEDIPQFIQKNFENLNVLTSEMGPSRQKFNEIVFQAPRAMTTKTPENPPISSKNQEYLQDRIYSTWGVDSSRDKTAIVVKDPDKQHGMTDQARMQRNEGTSKFFTTFDKTGINLKTASPQQVIDAARGRTLTKAEKDILQDYENGKKLTPLQLQTRMNAQRKLASEPELEWNPEQGLFILQDSFKAGAKELGGVNRITTMDRDGNVNVIVSDRHDMMGFDPVDGKPLLTVFPPMQYNVYKGRGKDAYNTRESQASARRRLAKELGEPVETVAPIYNKAGGIKQGRARLAGGEIVGEYSPLDADPKAFGKNPIYDKGRQGVARRVNQRIAQEAQNFRPTAGQVARQLPRVATNTALAGNYGLQGAGMLTGQPQDEQ